MAAHLRAVIRSKRVLIFGGVALALAATLTAAIYRPVGTQIAQGPVAVQEFSTQSPVQSTSASAEVAASAESTPASPEMTARAATPAETVAPPVAAPPEASVSSAPRPAAPAAPPAPAAPDAPVAPVAPVAPAAPAAPAQSWQLSQIQALFNSVVPAAERAALPASWVLTYNDPRESCGDGCTGIIDGHLETSFTPAFFNQSSTYQRNTMAHEIAHAYGYSHWSLYAYPSWAGLAGWLGQFHVLDRGFAGQYDAEAWASCVAWKESGFNNRVDQIAAPCTEQAAALAMAQIP